MAGSMQCHIVNDVRVGRSDSLCHLLIVQHTDVAGSDCHRVDYRSLVQTELQPPHCIREAKLPQARPGSSDVKEIPSEGSLSCVLCGSFCAWSVETLDLRLAF